MAAALGRHRGLLRLNYYPPASGEADHPAIRDGAHTDWTPFTILAADREGLEILEDGEWKPAPDKAKARRRAAAAAKS